METTWKKIPIGQDGLCIIIGDKYGNRAQEMLDSGVAWVVVVQSDPKIANRIQMRFADDKQVVVDRSEIGVDITFGDLVRGYGIPRTCILCGNRDILCDLSAYDIDCILYLKEGLE